MISISPSTYGSLYKDFNAHFNNTWYLNPRRSLIGIQTRISSICLVFVLHQSLLQPIMARLSLEAILAALFGILTLTISTMAWLDNRKMRQIAERREFRTKILDWISNC
jgi:hypothetical protein